MFSRKDMLDVKRHVRLSRLWEPTVFAAMAGSVTDRPLDGCVHHASATRARRARALAWRMLMKSIASTMSRYSAFSAFQQFPACDFRPENTLVLISHFANSLRIMLSRIPYLTTWANGVARHGTCSRCSNSRPCECD